MLELRIVTGPDAGRVLPLAERAVLRIGRAVPDGDESGATPVTLRDARLSRLHCEVRESEGRWLVKDLDSSNGTFVNAERIAEKELAPGDVLQLGGTVIEVAVEGETAAAPEPAAPPPPPRPRSRRARPGPRAASPAAPVVVILGVVLAGGAGLWFAVAGRGRSPESPAPPAATATRVPPSPAAPPRAASPAPATPAATDARARPAPGDDPFHAIEVAIAAAEWKRAARMLDGVAGERARVEALRERVLAGAGARLKEGMEQAGALIARGEHARAREDLEALALILPDAMVGTVQAELERLGRLESELVAGVDGGGESAGGAEAPDDARFRAGVAALAQRAKALGAGAPSREAWQALLDDARALVLADRRSPDDARLRSRLREVFVRAHVEVHRTGRAEERFHAASVAWTAGRLLLRYDFRGDEQLQDFRPVTPGSKATRQGRSLQVVGEVRVGNGDPFAGSLVVRAKVPAGGYRPEGPNINIALFTAAGDRLHDPGRKSVSLLSANLRGSGQVPDDFVVFGLGYRYSPVDYDGKPWEYITVPGQVEPVALPASLLLAGRHRSLLHTDQRECLQAETLGGPLAGAVSIVAAVDGGAVRWQVGGKDLLAAGDAARARLGARQDRRGSLTLLTYGDEVRFTALEIEGRLDPDWLDAELEDEAGRALEELER